MLPVEAADGLADLEAVVVAGFLWRTVPFFFQAEDGIRDLTVTGVQTCALPICGFGTQADAARSLEAGFSQHLVKPLTMETLDAALQAVMSLKFRKRRLARREPHS